jgi:hypothetical protein
VPFVNEEVVMVNGPGLTVNVTLAVSTDGLLESCTVIVAVVVVAKGVPLITPVPALKERPDGRPEAENV